LRRLRRFGLMNIVRIVSARKGAKKEREDYEKGI
jgi:uncharacterized DUF497 family protein